MISNWTTVNWPTVNSTIPNSIPCRVLLVPGQTMLRTVIVAALLGCGPKTTPVTSPLAETPTAPMPAAPVPAAPIPVETPSAVAEQSTDPAPAAPEAPTGAPWDESSAGNGQQLGDAVAMLTTRDSGRARSALELLKPMTAQYPDVAAIPYNMGVAYNILGDETEARRSWLRATEIDPKFAKAWLNLGALSLGKGSADAALSSFQSGIRHAPTDIDLRVAAISAQRALKRYPEAVAEGKSALQMNSRAIELYNQLALVYLETGQIDLATFMCYKAMEAADGADKNAQLQANFGTIFLKQGYEGDAVGSFNKALDLDPNQLSALQFLSSYYLDNRNYKAAMPLLERIVSQVPLLAGPRINLGIALRGEGRYEESVAAYNEALRLDPGNAEPHRNLAVLYGDYLKSYDQAIAEIEAYRRNGGNQAGDLDAWIAQIKKDKEKAEKRKKKAEDDRLKRDAESAPPPPTVIVEPVPAPTEVVPVPAPAPAPEVSPPTEGSDPNTPWGGQQ